MLLLDAQGEVAAHAFGDSIAYGPSSNPWLYVGKRLDRETGLCYFGQRFYDPQMRRWLTPDPVGFADGYNLYAYVHNHPLRYTDPDGQLALLLAPLAISLAVDIALPIAAAYLQPYLGVTAGTFVTGLAAGYTGSLIEVGTHPCLGCEPLLRRRMWSPPRGSFFNHASYAAIITAATNTITSEATGVAAAMVTSRLSRCMSWFSHSTARTAAPQALAKTSQIATQVSHQTVNCSEKQLIADSQTVAKK